MAFGKEATHLQNGYPQGRLHCRADWGLKTESGLAEDMFPNKAGGLVTFMEWLNKEE